MKSELGPGSGPVVSATTEARFSAHFLVLLGLGLAAFFLVLWNDARKRDEALSFHEPVSTVAEMTSADCVLSGKGVGASMVVTYVYTDGAQGQPHELQAWLNGFESREACAKSVDAVRRSQGQRTVWFERDRPEHAGWQARPSMPTKVFLGLAGLGFLGPLGVLAWQVTRRRPGR